MFMIVMEKEYAQAPIVEEDSVVLIRLHRAQLDHHLMLRVMIICGKSLGSPRLVILA
jgi:hypothetical protein